MVGLYSRMEGTTERISECEDGKTKIIHSKQQRENRLKTKIKQNKEQILRDLCDYNKRSNIHVVSVSEGMGKKAMLKKYSKNQI